MSQPPSPTSPVPLSPILAYYPPPSPITISHRPLPIVLQPHTKLRLQKQAQTFHPFPRLPLELRLKIFTHILSIPRVVSIAYVTKPAAVQTEDDDRISPQHGRGGGRRPFSDVRNSGRGRLVNGPRFVSKWVSYTHGPAALGVCQELREQALKTYPPAFTSIESPAHIPFNFASDILYFGNAAILLYSSSAIARKSVLIPPHLQGEAREPAPYRLDLFLGGDYYGVSTVDFKRIRRLALDVPEELYGRRSFCWEDVRNMTGLEEVWLIVWEDEQDDITGSNSTQERCMRFFHNSLSRVWDKYSKGYGEGVGAELGEGEEKEWNIPKVEVWNACTGACWGEVKLKKGVVAQ